MEGDVTVRCEPGVNHHPRRLVLTGGPGAGKTAVLEALKHLLSSQVAVLPESAGIIFGGGFPRLNTLPGQRAAQRAIFYVQRELEAIADESNFAAVLCDRGLPDAVAYWPGPDDFWASVGMTAQEALARYDVVIHLRVPDAAHGYARMNPLRIESADEAAAIDQRILNAWSAHPRRHIVEAASDFLAKAASVLTIIQRELAGGEQRVEAIIAAR